MIFSTKYNDYLIYGLHEGEDSNAYFILSKDLNKIIDKFNQFLSIKILIWAEYYTSESRNGPAQTKLKTYPINQRIFNRNTFIMPVIKGDFDPFKRLSPSPLLNRGINLIAKSMVKGAVDATRTAILKTFCKKTPYGERFSQYKLRTI